MCVKGINTISNYQGDYYSRCPSLNKWAEISTDFVESLPKSKGKSVILVVVNRMSKYSHFLPLTHPYTAEKVA